MRRIHALTVLAALGLHTLLALPWVLRPSQAKASRPASQVAVELPIDVESTRPRGQSGRAQRRARARVPEDSKAAAPTPAAAPERVASPAAKPAPPPPAAAAVAPAPVVAPTPGPAPAPESAALAAGQMFGARARAVLLIHSAPLRESALGRVVGASLTKSAALSAFFEAAELEPLRDFDHFLLTTSVKPTTTTAVLQFNVPRFRVRSAAARSHGELGFSLPAPQILVLAGQAGQAAAEGVPRSFRLPEPAGVEAAELFVHSPSTQLSRLVLPADASPRWLALRLLLGDGAAELTWQAADASAAPDALPRSGSAPIDEAKVPATWEALLSELK